MNTTPGKEDEKLVKTTVKRISEDNELFSSDAKVLRSV